MSLSPSISTTSTPRTPIASASSRIDVAGVRPLLDSWSHLLLSVPAMCVTSFTSTPAAIQSREKTIAALVTLSPLGLSVMAHVKAVTLSPRRATLLPPHPRAMCPRTAKIAPRNSERFWNDESSPNPRNRRSAAPTPTATSASPSLLYHIRPAPLSDESNSATTVGVSGAKDAMARVNSTSLCRTRHSMALQHWMATTASADRANSAWGSVRPHAKR